MTDESCLVPFTVTNMYTMLIGGQTKSFFKQCESKADLGHTLGDDGEPCEESFRRILLVTDDLLAIERANPAGVVDIPKGGVRRGRNDGRAVRRRKHLGLGGL